jgi:hypothetical protein
MVCPVATSRRPQAPRAPEHPLSGAPAVGGTEPQGDLLTDASANPVPASTADRGTGTVTPTKRLGVPRRPRAAVARTTASLPATRHRRAVRAAAPVSAPIVQRVAVVIPAKDESRRIAATVRAARAIPHVDLVLVVDDGSEDSTQHVAREAGAVVVRHSHNRGKAAAMETGAAVVAMRDVEEGPARLLLFIDGDLGESAVNAAPLVPPVLADETDATIALLPPQQGAGGHGIVTGLARRSIQSMTGWTPAQPLSGMRCLTRAAFEAATPLAHGWGVETGMTIDLLTQGFRIEEVPCDLRHRPSGTDFRGQVHRAAQYRDVLLAVNARRVRRVVTKVRRRVEED